MYTAFALLLVISICGSQVLSRNEYVGPDGCTTIGVCPISSPVVPIEPTTSTQSMVTSEPPLTTSTAVNFIVEAAVAQNTSAMAPVSSTRNSEYNATSVAMPVSTQRVNLTASPTPMISLGSSSSVTPVMSTSSLNSCHTICPTTTTPVEPTNPTTNPERPTTGSPTKNPTNAPAAGSNVGLAVGLTLLVLVILTVVLVVAAIIIYKRCGKYTRTTYEVLPTGQ